MRDCVRVYSCACACACSCARLTFNIKYPAGNIHYGCVHDAKVRGYCEKYIPLKYTNFFKKAKEYIANLCIDRFKAKWHFCVTSNLLRVTITYEGKYYNSVC